VNHHTYRFARRAEAEGMVVIDDPASIRRCTNKVYLAETMARHRIATPRTLILSKDNALDGLRALGFPCVLKRPDSSFSTGVERCDAEATHRDARCLLRGQRSARGAGIRPHDFDWRIGVLGGEPLFACRYGMAPEHWQIVKRDDDGVHEGDAETLPVEEAPATSSRLAARSRQAHGRRALRRRPQGRPRPSRSSSRSTTIPTSTPASRIALGDELYRRIMQHFFWKLESR
jgi:hypothetical protein